MTNISLTVQIIETLVRQGVSEFMVCAGARNATFVKVLGRTKNLKVHHFYEERSAAFFALGRARRLDAPVAVVTTSGTAAAELYPAVIEAHYTSAPLVLVTADRPASYRGTGAPQAIDQIQIFNNYAGETCQWDVNHQPQFRIDGHSPKHLNISFDEPLLDGVIEESYEFTRPEPIDHRSALHSIQDSDRAAAAEFVERAKHPLMLLSELPKTDLQLPNVISFSESASHQKSVTHLRAFDAFYSVDNFRKHFDSVIRVGSVPTHRIWRDLDGALSDIPVISFSGRPFRGLSRKHALLPISALDYIKELEYQPKNILAQDEYRIKKITQLMAEFPDAEPSLMYKVCRSIPKDSFVFLGNSLSIREWDYFRNEQGKDFEIGVMRGVNGIDGTISHFIGRLKKDVENWLVLGDLSTLYDMAGLSFKKQIADYTIRIVIMNNAGGKIFTPMFNDANFEFQHDYKFEHLAEMFGWSYANYISTGKLDQHSIIEIKPDNQATKEFMNQYKKLKALEE